MNTNHDYWTIEKLLENIGNVEYPEFQREPFVWNLGKKQKLIDSTLRGFDISSIYFHKISKDKYDCIDGRQRLSAILSYLKKNPNDEHHNGFNLKIENEIYNESGQITKLDGLRFDSLNEDLDNWKQKILNYKLNIVFLEEVESDDEELNLLFLRLQIASVLNPGEKLNAMTGEMRNWIFAKLSQHPFFAKISIPTKRFAGQQVAAQIALNAFSKKYDGVFHRCRYVDLQNFFKDYSTFDQNHRAITDEILHNLNIIHKKFETKLNFIKNRALAVSVYLFVSELIEQELETDIDEFVVFLEKFLKTLKWQVPKGVKMDEAYYDLLNFQSRISSAAGEKSAIEKRHTFLKNYFSLYQDNKKIVGDDDYGGNPDEERKSIVL